MIPQRQKLDAVLTLEVYNQPIPNIYWFNRLGGPLPFGKKVDFLEKDSDENQTSLDA